MQKRRLLKTNDVDQKLKKKMLNMSVRETKKMYFWDWCLVLLRVFLGPSGYNWKVQHRWLKDRIHYLFWVCVCVFLYVLWWEFGRRVMPACDYRKCQVLSGRVFSSQWWMRFRPENRCSFCTLYLLNSETNLGVSIPSAVSDTFTQ